MVILLYHNVDKGTSARGLYSIDEELFKKELLWLKENDYRALSLGELVNILQPSSQMPEKSVAITFDDGLSSQFEFAYPILKQFRFPACFFIIADRVGLGGYMNWQQIKRMKEDAMEIGSHGLSHQLFELMSEPAIAEELQKSKEILESRLQAEIAYFSIPRGSTRRSKERMISTLAKEAGYKALCSSRVGYIESSRTPFFLPRFALKRSDTFGDFIQVVERDPYKFFCSKGKELAIDLLKSLIGLKGYECVRKVLFPEEYRHERPRP